MTASVSSAGTEMDSENKEKTTALVTTTPTTTTATEEWQSTQRTQRCCGVFSTKLTITQWCCIVSLVCTVWNLFGDLYYLDYFYAYTITPGSDDDSDEASNNGGMAVISSTARQGNIFDFTNSGWAALIAQSGGWMYPIWAVATVLPFYPALVTTMTKRTLRTTSTDDGDYVADDEPYTTTYSSDAIRRALVPCLFLMYGLCIVGGSLHSAFAFIAVIPDAYHNYFLNVNNDDDGNVNILNLDFLNHVQSRLVKKVFWGSGPGLLATNIASIWITWIIQFPPARRATAGGDASSYSSTKIIPRWFNWFSPLVTNIWILHVSSLALSPTVAFYVDGCLASFVFGIWNLGIWLALGRRDVRCRNGNSCGQYLGPEQLLSQFCKMTFVINDMNSETLEKDENESKYLVPTITASDPEWNTGVTQSHHCNFS